MRSLIKLCAFLVVLFSINSCGELKIEKPDDGWQYECDVYVTAWRSQTQTMKLYRKSLDSAIVYQIEDGKKRRMQVQFNPSFGYESNYKYKADEYFFNLPYEDVSSELAEFKAKKWMFIKDVKMYHVTISSDKRNVLTEEYGNLYWREYKGGQYMVVPCGSSAPNYDKVQDNKRKYREPQNPQQIIATPTIHFLEYEEYMHMDENYKLVMKWVVRSKTFYYKAAEYSLNL